jgi:hypothetical protein
LWISTVSTNEPPLMVIASIGTTSASECSGRSSMVQACGSPDRVTMKARCIDVQSPDSAPLSIS